MTIFEPNAEQQLCAIMALDTSERFLEATETWPKVMYASSRFGECFNLQGDDSLELNGVKVRILGGRHEDKFFCFAVVR